MLSYDLFSKWALTLNFFFSSCSFFSFSFCSFRSSSNLFFSSFSRFLSRSLDDSLWIEIAKLWFNELGSVGQEPLHYRRMSLKMRWVQLAKDVNIPGVWDAVYSQQEALSHRYIRWQPQLPPPRPTAICTIGKVLIRKPHSHPHGLLTSLTLASMGMHEHVFTSTRINFDVTIS